MRRFGKLAVCLGLTAALFTGCGQASVPDSIKEPTLILAGDGSVTACLVGAFDKSYYDISELLEMAREEAAEYGTTPDGKARVMAQSAELSPDDGSRVVLTYLFDGTESYEDFIGGKFFYGTVEEAFLRGYGGVILKSVSDGTAMTGEELAREKNRHLIVTDAAMTVYCPERVDYLSEGAVLNNDGSVNTSGAEGIVYILLRR